jgi:acyl-CoA thioesterase YciA
MTDSPRQIPDRETLALKAMMMPRDANPHGTIFGGVLLSHMDQAGAIGAYELLGLDPEKKTLVTVAMQGVEFREPVLIGDVLEYWVRVEQVGRTSVTVRIAVSASRGTGKLNVTNACNVYVALDLSAGARTKTPIFDD